MTETQTTAVSSSAAGVTRPTQAQAYSVEALVAHAAEFGTRPFVVRAAMTNAGKDTVESLEDGRKLVHDFLRHKLS